MSTYESTPGVEATHITTVRRMQKAHKHGQPLGDEPSLWNDLFTDITPSDSDGDARNSSQH